MSLLNNPTYVDEVQHKEKTLELRKYAAQVGIGRTTQHSMVYDTARDFVSDTLIHRVSMDIFSNKIVDDNYKANFSYEVYDSPWQFFKHRYMPVWFIKWRPVKHKTKHGNVTVNFTRYSEYPKADIELEDTKFYKINLGGYSRFSDTVRQTDYTLTD